MKYIVIGAVAGGASAAARLRRLDEKAEIVLFEKGGYISYANCGLPYYIGDVIKERDKLLVQKAASFHSRFNIDVRIQSLVTSIDTARHLVSVIDLVSGRQYDEHYDKLVLSPGAEPMRPPLPGIGLPGIFTLRNVADTDRIKEHVRIHRSGKAVIIGGGFIGLEMAENLHALGMSVTVVEMGDQILAPFDYAMAARVQQHLRAQGVHILLRRSVTGFGQNGNGLDVQLSDGGIKSADLVILSIGVRPDTALAKAAGLRIGSSRGIWVNEYMQTSDPDIYAVGDAVEFANPITGASVNTYLAGPANKQGRICATNIVTGNTITYRGSVNTAIVQVFGMTAGTAGMASKHLLSAGIPHLVSTTHSGSHAGYYPGSQQMAIQISFAPGTGRLLGAQVVGYEGADKRLDILSGIISQGGTIYELTGFEHAYAPPYSSAKDPVNMAGFAAENILTGRMDVINSEGLEGMPGALLLDVRTAMEFNDGTIPGSLNVPIDELRDRVVMIPRDRDIVVFCQVGMRGYLAQRILMQHGFNRVRNLSGGYSSWRPWSEERSLLKENDLKVQAV